MNKSPKVKGEKGQCIVIGELAKHDIQCAIPLSDNLPFDLIIIHGEKLYKAQIKTSSYCNKQTKGSIAFDLTTNNWHQKVTKKYKKGDVDLFLLCDYKTVYILTENDFLGRRSFSIRTVATKNGQTKNCNMAEDYEISDKRIKDCFL